MFVICVFSLLFSHARAASLDLSGIWEVEIESGHKFSITLPGSLQSHGIGEPITVATKWTGGIFDRSWFEKSEYALYRQPGNLKVPFWLQPETHYVT